MCKFAAVASTGSVEKFKERDPRVADAWLACTDKAQELLRIKYGPEIYGQRFKERLAKCLFGEAFDRAENLGLASQTLMFKSAKVALRYAENDFQRNLIALDDDEANLYWQPE